MAGRQSPDEAIVILFDPKRRHGEVTRLLVEPNPDDESPADFYETDFNVMAQRVEQIAADPGQEATALVVGMGATTRLDL